MPKYTKLDLFLFHFFIQLHKLLNLISLKGYICEGRAFDKYYQLYLYKFPFNFNDLPMSLNQLLSLAPEEGKVMVYARYPYVEERCLCGENKTVRTFLKQYKHITVTIPGYSIELSYNWFGKVKVFGLQKLSRLCMSSTFVDASYYL